MGQRARCQHLSASFTEDISCHVFYSGLDKITVRILWNLSLYYDTAFPNNFIHFGWKRHQLLGIWQYYFKQGLRLLRGCCVTVWSLFNAHFTLTPNSLWTAQKSETYSVTYCKGESNIKLLTDSIWF